MADKNYNYDLSKSIKNKTITLQKNKTSAINFSNDVTGQVVMNESKDNIVFTIYKTQKTTYTYTKVVEKYEPIELSSRYKVTTTKYVYSKVPNENNSWEWKATGKTSERVVSLSDKPSQITEDKQYWVAYSMQSSGSSSSSFHTSSYYATTKDTAMDATYQDIIDRYGTEVKTVTDKVQATITVKNADKATKLTLHTDRNMGNDPDNPLDLKNTYYSAVHKDNKFTGTFLNEIANSSDADETFTLKTGNDVINYGFFEGFNKMGKDVVNVAKGENLTLNMLHSTKNDTDLADMNTDMYVNTAFAKKGNDIILKYTNENGTSLGQTTIKNYFKIAQDNVTLAYSGSSSSVIDKEYSLRDVLAYEDGIGFLGNESSKKDQNITGNFVDNTITTGSGKDTIKAVAGDNLIVAGKNDDTIYSGTGQDSFFIYEGDATGSKGDKIYNADMNDSIYFLVGDDNEIGPTYFAETTDPGEPPVTHAPNFEFTKKGNSLVINYNKESVFSPSVDKEKVTFVDYFKKNSILFNINDALDYSTITINQTAKGTVKGTEYNDDIYLSGKSTVYTGAGNDTIRFYSVTGTSSTITNPVEANVTTNINGVGTKTFERVEGYGENAGDMGNKTIVFQNDTSKTAVANLNLLGKGAPGETAPASTGYIYSKSGNNLVIEGYYSYQAGYVYNPDNDVNEYGSYGSYTIKDYFKDGNYVGTVNLDGEELDLDAKVIYQEGKKNTAAKFYDSKYDDYIIGANKNDKYYFTSGGNDRARDIKGNDTYNVSSLANGLSITDMAGKDSLIISDTNAHSLYFDITVDGSSLSTVGKNLQIFDKTKMEGHAIVGGITVNDYIAEYTAGGTVTKGAGCIETIKANGKAVSVDVNTIANAVAGWLSDKGYTSSANVFTDHPGDIDAMLTVYTTGVYNKA